MPDGSSAARRYWTDIVVPTLREFAEAAYDQRRASFACLVLHHAPEHCFVERLGASEAQRAQTGYWAARGEPEFMAVHAVAVALKHGERSKDIYSLRQVHSRPPAECGLLECGWSELGDTQGSVLAQQSPTTADLVDLHAAIAFVVNQLSRDFPEFGIAEPALPAGEADAAECKTANAREEKEPDSALFRLIGALAREAARADHKRALAERRVSDQVADRLTPQ